MQVAPEEQERKGERKNLHLYCMLYIIPNWVKGRKGLLFLVREKCLFVAIFAFPGSTGGATKLRSGSTTLRAEGEISGGFHEMSCDTSSTKPLMTKNNGADQESFASKSAP